MSKIFTSHHNIVEFDANLQKLASSFCCGNEFIDNFLKGSLALDSAIGKTYVWLSDDNSRIIGFYNITTGSVEELRDGKLYKIGGAVHINDFAVDVSYQKTLYDSNHSWYISDVLLLDCIERIEAIRDNSLGFSFVTLASTKEGFNLYSRNDFESMEDEMQIPIVEDKESGCIPMYLPLDYEY